MLQEYRQHLLAAGRGTGTVKLYTRRIERFAVTHPRLTAVTLDELEAYLAARRHLAAETRKSIRTAFRSFYGWAHSSGRMTSNPALGLLPIAIPVTPPRVAPDAVVRDGLDRAPLQIRAMIMLARYGCLRLSEVTSLHTRHREGDLLRVTGKGEKQRMVPANDDLLYVLRQLELEQGEGFYFPGRFGGHLHKESVSKIISRTLGVNPHSLRHAGATAAYEATGDLRAVQMLLGHASIATTQRYLNIGMDAVRRAAHATALGHRPSTPSPIGARRGALSAVA